MDFQEFRVLPRIVSQILIHGVRHLLTYLVATGSYFLYFFLRLSTYLANLPPPLTLPLSQFIIHSLSYLFFFVPISDFIFYLQIHYFWALFLYVAYFSTCLSVCSAHPSMIVFNNYQLTPPLSIFKLKLPTYCTYLSFSFILTFFSTVFPYYLSLPLSHPLRPSLSLFHLNVGNLLASSVTRNSTFIL